MRKPRRRKPRQPRPAPLQELPALPKPSKAPWSITKKLVAAALALATLIGAPSALLALLPRITVEGSGDFSKPASIAFLVTNTGSIPLRYPTVSVWDCEIAYGKEPDTPPPPCKTLVFDQEYINEKGQKWLDSDSKITVRLEDMIRVEGGTSIKRANVQIIVRFYPWYLPIRFDKRFGFKTVKGTDGLLYWVAYSV
jgi:hypothetical protein